MIDLYFPFYHSSKTKENTHKYYGIIINITGT